MPPATLAGSVQQQAQRRLELSRRRLHEALRGVDLAPPAPTPGPPGARPSPAGAPTWPGLALAMGNRSLSPCARRHPWWLLLGGAACGALLVASRPWRWAPQALLAPGLVRPLVTTWLRPLLLRAVAQALVERAQGSSPASPPRP